MDIQTHLFEGDLPPELLASYQAAGRLGVDTETMGLVPQRDRLCVVQLADPAGRATLVRIAPGQTAAPNLKSLLEDAQVLKIFHFARFDLATLQYHLGIHVQPVFCTKIASKLARTYSPRHGLKEVVLELTGVELDKQAQSSDWGRPDPLSAEQLRYAANDVLYLPAVHEKLVAMLHREGRWNLAQRCLAHLPTQVALDLAGYEGIFEH